MEQLTKDAVSHADKDLSQVLLHLGCDHCLTLSTVLSIILILTRLQQGNQQPGPV
jgi:hypothetical protein